MKLNQLREKRNVLAREANAINDKFPADQRMPKPEAERLDAILNDIEQVDEEISREVRRAKLADDASPQQQHEHVLNIATQTPARQDNKAETAALRAYLSGGLGALSNEQRQLMNARVNADIRQAMMAGIQNAMSTTTPAEGGYTTAPEYIRTLLETQAAFGGMRGAGATLINTATGTQMLWPTADATAEQGEIVGQNAAVTGQDTTFGQVTLDVFKYSSKKIALPFELLQDSFFNIDAYIQGILALRIARIQATHHTVGTGVGQPQGLITGTTVGKVGLTGQTGSVIYDDLVDLEHSVDPVYRSRPGVGYMMHDSSLKVLRKLKDTQGRPIFVPGYETGNPGGAPDRLMGRAIKINQAMPVMAANAKSIAFGDMSAYMIRDVMDLTLFRMTDSAFTLNGQVGFVAFQRSGGKVVTGGMPVKTYQNSAT